MKTMPIVINGTDLSEYGYTYQVDGLTVTASGYDQTAEVTAKDGRSLDVAISEAISALFTKVMDALQKEASHV